MKSETAGAWALILGSLASVALMAFHPTHAAPGATLGPWSMNSMVHATAIVATPLQVFGLLMLTRFQGDRPLTQLALVFYGFGAFAIISAATMSGLVMQQLTEAAHTAGASTTGIDFQSLANQTHWLNQGFANVYTGLASLAVLLWSLSWQGAGAWIMRVAGLVLAGGILAWQLSGTLELNIHGMAAVALSQMLWMLLAATMMLRETSKARGSIPQ